ncbi:MAG: hypothetical protein Q8R13_00775 [bacterium]|nr:hypothetical protein [bacterium]MDZ4296128.1 hypothetical protein [Patescibacteria group bacterium]
MKKPTHLKKLRLPFQKMTGREKNYAAVILENVRDDFKIFGESLDVVKSDVQTLKRDMGTVKGDVQTLKGDMGTVKGDMATVKSELAQVKAKTDATFEAVGKLSIEMAEVKLRLDTIEKELVSIKNEIGELRTALAGKAEVARLELLEVRVANIEAELKKRRAA